MTMWLQWCHVCDEVILQPHFSFSVGSWCYSTIQISIHKIVRPFCGKTWGEKSDHGSSRRLSRGLEKVTEPNSFAQHWSAICFFFFEILSLSRIPVPFLGRKTICNRFVIQKELERSTIAQSIGNFSLKVFPPKKSLFGPIFSKIRLPGPNGHVWQAPSSFYSMTFVFSSVDI